MTTGATKQLARYAVNLRYRDIPPEVISRAKDCLLDIITVALYGSTKPWSQTVVQFVKDQGLSGRSTVSGREPASAGSSRRH